MYFFEKYIIIKWRIQLRKEFNYMAVSFEKSNTKINLMKAFAGESQARNRYTMAASQAKKEGLNIVEKVFTFTANQEKEHAKLFYQKLSPVYGTSINIECGFPVDIYNNSLDLLKCARNNEYEEYNDVYRSFSEEARSEGFNDIAALFSQVADIEKVHAERFEKFIDLIENGELFESSKEERWICLNCGYIYTSKSALENCPVCNHSKGYQMRHDWVLI